MQKLNDSILVQRIKKGNRDAFRKLYDRYHEQLYFLAKRYLKDQYLAEDAVQDLFLKVWTKKNMLQSSSIRGFLFTSMKNHLIDVIRKQKTNTKAIENYKELSISRHDKNETIEKIIYDEYREAVQKALQNISLEKRKVFEMKTFEGLSNAEVADKKDVTINTVKTQFYLSTKYVRKYLKKHAGFGN